jgi:hypothetical protein
MESRKSLGLLDIYHGQRCWGHREQNPCSVSLVLREFLIYIMAWKPRHCLTKPPYLAYFTYSYYLLLVDFEITNLRGLGNTSNCGP